MTPRRTFILTPAVAMANTSGTLAIHPAALGKAQSLMAEGDGVGEAVADAGVALLHLRGPLTQRTTMHMCGVSLGYDSVTAGFARLMADPAVAAVVLVIDSPGGDVPGLFSCVRDMVSIRLAAGKPVLAYADEMACSAAYAIACVADRGIFLPSTGEVGSVGVLSIHEDQSLANQQAGLTHTILKSGARKAEGNPLEPLSDTARISLQTRVESLAEEFFSLVVAARGLSVDRVKGLEGASLSGTAAVAAGLADGIASLAEVVGLAATAATQGTPMTAEEKDEMEALKARLQAAEDKLAALDPAEEEPAPESAPAEEEPAPEEEPSDEEDPKAEVAKLKAEIARRDIAAAVDAASRQGRVEPSRRAGMITLGERIGLDSLRVVLDAMVPHRVSTKGSAKAPAAAPELSAIEQTVAKQMGVTNEAFLASKVKLASIKETV